MLHVTVTRNRVEDVSIGSFEGLEQLLASVLHQLLLHKAPALCHNVIGRPAHVN